MDKKTDLYNDTAGRILKKGLIPDSRYDPGCTKL